MSTDPAGADNQHSENYNEIEDTHYRDLYAKIHARAIHRHHQTPEDQRPHISEHTAQYGRDFAHQQIIGSLEFLKECGANNTTDIQLRNAAQLLEKLYINETYAVQLHYQELQMAAMAYYLAGYYARAFVLMQGTADIKEASDILMRLMFLRNLPEIKAVALRNLSHNECNDTSLARSIEEGDITDTRAIELALEGTLNRMYSLFYEYARTGLEKLINLAIDLSHIGAVFALEQGDQEWWWKFQCTSALLREYRQNSLWKCLQPMIDNDPSHLVKRYIKAAFSRKPWPILELWRSQSHVLEQIQDGNSYCIKMPTSSGKTRIAELAILKFLIESREEPEKKCIYLAPYRALAVELQHSLGASFKPIGIGVSQLYGSYDLNPADTLIAEDSRILIATPEKMDAFLRYNEEIAKQVGLIIVDEGHIIDQGERGLRYELFLHRLVKRYERQGIRILLMSAVLPNVEQFAQWITGKKDRILSYNWQATQLLLGVLSWEQGNSRITYKYRDRIPVDQDFFISKYVSPFDPAELKAIGDTRTKLPGKNPTKAILAAKAAIEATKEGSTLIFVAQKNAKFGIVKVAETLIEVTQLQEKINEHFKRSVSVLPKNISDPDKANKLNRCIRYAEEVTGSNSLVVRALRHGFVVHHGDIPRSLRIRLEELIREGILQLVIATTTLAQGVNLPLKTILIHSLQLGKGLTLSNRDFWNLCGRAGRAMYETEGAVYLLATNTKEYDTACKKLKQYVIEAETEKVISAVRQLLEKLVDAWHQRFSLVEPINIALLCQKLADDNDIGLELDPSTIKELKVLDVQLLATVEEHQIDIINPDKDLTTKIADLFQDSMLYIQLNSEPQTKISATTAIDFIVQRIQRISRVCKSKRRLERYYKMGIYIEDCSIVESFQQDLAEYIQQSVNYMDWDNKERSQYIVKLCSKFLMQLSNVNEGLTHPDYWEQILELWLMGKNAKEIAQNISLSGSDTDPMTISTDIDNLCEFRLTWGLNALAMFWKTNESAEENSEETSFAPPDIVNYFASMLRFGVHDPVATVALAMGLDNRQASLILATHYTVPSLEAPNIFHWLQVLDWESVKYWTNDQSELQSLNEFIKSIQRGISLEFPTTRDVKIIPDIQNWDSLIDEGAELLGQIEDRKLYLYTQTIDYMGSYTIQDDGLLKMLKNSNVFISVKHINYSANHAILTLVTS